MPTRYYIAVDVDNPLWREVTKETFVRVERAAGFHNTMGQPEEPATHSFGGRGVRGKTEYVREDVA